MKTKKLKNIKVIVFDLDGTALNTDLYVVMNHLQLMNRFMPNYKPTLKQLISFSGPSLDETFDKYYVGIDKKILKEEFRDFSKKYSNFYSSLYENEIEVLRSLKEAGYTLCIFTTKARDRSIDNLTYFKIISFFDILITSDDVSKFKPNPEGLIKIMNHFNITNDELIMIGDSEMDYYAAQSVNVKSVMATWGLKKLSDEIKPFKFVQSYDQIKEIFVNE